MIRIHLIFFYIAHDYISQDKLNKIFTIIIFIILFYVVMGLIAPHAATIKLQCSGRDEIKVIVCLLIQIYHLTTYSTMIYIRLVF